jgi:hypothetical protein
MVQMTEEMDHRHWIRTRWVKRRYFVQDGYIRPVPGGESVLYDPFLGYSHEDHPTKDRSSYLQLLDVKLDDEREIEEWTSTWGLLGLFQDRLVQARRTIQTKTGPETLIEWGSTAAASSVFEGLASSGPGKPTDSKVLLAWEPLGEIVERPLEEYFRKYFPFLQPEQHYPPLASPKLWDHLSEPLDEFKIAVHNLRFTVERAKTGPSKTGDAIEDETQAWMHPRRLQHTINPRVQRVYRAVRPTADGGLAAVWVFPSLLSALYTMLMEDVTGGRLRECSNERCRKPFVPGRSDQSYCSTRCKNAVLQRRRRGTER